MTNTSKDRLDTSVTLRHPPYSYIHLSLVKLHHIRAQQPLAQQQQQQQQQQHQQPAQLLDPVTVLSYLNSALQSYLGLSGTAIPVDVLKTQNEDAWIRIPFEDASAVIASLSQWSGRSGAGGVQLRVKGSGTWLGGLVAASEDEELLWTWGK